MKRMIVGSVAALVLVFAGAGAANAGEVNGKGDPIPAPDKAHSECVYSGLDTLDSIEMNPPQFDDDALAMVGNQSPGGKDRYHGVQSYGIFVKAGLKDVIPMSPGTSCRGH
ncbi:hypothetical protein P0L94_01350 [Microbacter sp. GSS18]|nr:hypothetical protein P0L94_01350 [Microbacter sp. GSS18]